MRNSIIKFIFLVPIVLLLSCENQEITMEEAAIDQEVVFKNINEIIQLNLGEKFDIPEDIYSEFIAETIFINNTLRGFKYDNIDNVLTDDQSHAFWKHFGIQVRYSENKDIGDIDALDPKPAYAGKRPITGGCEPALGYYCFGNGANDIQNYKPITGGCSVNRGWVCFNP